MKQRSEVSAISKDDDRDPLTFEFERLSLDPAYLDRREVLLDVIGDFRIRVGNVVIFDQPLFPVVEFATALAQWRAVKMLTRSPFEYVSAEAEESPLIEFVPIDGGWSVQSPWLERPYTWPIARSDLADATSRFVADVRAALLYLQIDLNEALTNLERGSKAR